MYAWSDQPMHQLGAGHKDCHCQSCMLLHEQSAMATIYNAVKRRSTRLARSHWTGPDGPSCRYKRDGAIDNVLSLVVIPHLPMNLMPQPAVVPAGQDAAPAEGGSKWTGIARSMAMFMAMQWGMSSTFR